MKDFDVFFSSITDFKPYHFQKECFKKIKEGNSIILQAPTGSGKTLASVMPFVHNWLEWKSGYQDI